MSTSSSATTSPFAINLSWDASVSAAPNGFTAAVLAAARHLETQFDDPVTINLSIGYGEVDGSAMQDALGETKTYLSRYSYSSLLAAVTADAKSADDRATLSPLATYAPVNGTFWATTAQARALGLASGSETGTDAFIGFSSSYQFTYDDTQGVAPGTYDLNGVALHEITEAMGRMLFTGNTIAGVANSFDLLDLLHYSSAGVRQFSGTAPGYFSVDGGRTNVGQFNVDPNGDPGDWSSSMGQNAFDAFTAPGAINAVTRSDLREMDVLGWDMSAAVTSRLVLEPTISGIVGVPYTGVRLFGTCEPGSTVTVTDTENGKTAVLGTTTTAADGAWSFMSVSGLGYIDSSTVHNYSVAAEDPAGNTGKIAGGLFLTDIGQDILHATPGVAEVFAIMSNLGTDTIEGFQPASSAGANHDVLNFSGRGISSYNQVQSIMSGDSSAIFTLAGGKTVTLTDVAPSWLTAADFRFT